MKFHPFSFAVLTTTLIAILPSALAEDKPGAKEKADKAPSAEELEMAKKWEAAATPGVEHKALEPLVGEWNVASKCWMSPDGPPMESKGTTTTKWILGGRFLQDDFNGEFMGKPMKGLGITGYDNLKKKYNSFWIDEGGTAMYTSTGKATKDGKTFTFTGKMDDPMTGEKDKTMKFVIQIDSSEKHTFQMFDASKGKDSKCAEMVYTKK
jgi:hypothetical protein